MRDPHPNTPTSLRNLLEAWAAPSAAFRGKPLWCWNGRLDREEALRQVRIFKEMGMGGFIMHSRTGLATEYLGEEWFELINLCADEAERIGLEAWLYDEDRWPSGTAGGQATRDPHYRMKYLRLSVTRGADVPAWPDRDHFAAAFEADLDGLNLGNYERVSHGASTPAGRSLLIFSWELMAEHSFYNGAAYLDTMSREATDKFLALTHDRYAERCGDRIGRSIKGIFTDEPHRGFVMCSQHGQPMSDPGWTTPWTPELFGKFEEAFGHDLRDRLPELFLRLDGNHVSRVKWEYMELIQRLFLENWARPMQERCREMGLTLTGHALHEDTLGAQAVPCGSVMRFYEFLDYPGVDVLSLHNQNYWIVKQLTSVARQTGRRWLMSELYGCSGWQMGFDGHKRIGDWQALLGINFRCHHLCWYSMAGESKRDYPASIFFQSAWYREYERVETYFSRLHVLLQAGAPCCDVLVINPVESVWARIHPDWAEWLQAADIEGKRLDQDYQQLFAWLTGAHIDFDYGDEEQLARLALVDSSSATLRLGRMSYRTVIVSGMETMRATTLDLLRRFHEAGGSVIFVGEPPAYVDAIPSQGAHLLSEVSIRVGSEREEVVSTVRHCGGASGHWELDTRGASLLSQLQKCGDDFIGVIINPSETNAVVAVTINARATGSVMELDCLSGEKFTVSTDPGRLAWETSFAPLQERVFIFGPNVPSTFPRRIERTFSESRELHGPFDYELDEPNICVLDFARFRVAGGEWEPCAEILQIEKILSERFDIPMRSGQMVQPWADVSEAPSATIPMELKFGFAVDCLPPESVFLLLEQPTLHQLSVNGTAVEIPAETDWFIDPCFRRIPLPPGILRIGGNEVVLKFEYHKGVDLEAVCLLGSFGVALREKEARLIRLPDKLRTGSVVEQGLPFYSGRIRYRLPAGRAGRLELKPLGVAAVTFRGSGEVCVPWAPFQCDIDNIAGDDGIVIAELILTRRNTFGPLHLAGFPPEWTGPESFRSREENWRDDHVLMPVGLDRATILF